MVLNADIIVACLVDITMQDGIYRLFAGQLPEDHDRVAPDRGQIIQSPGLFAGQRKGKLQDGSKSGGKTIWQGKIMIIHIAFYPLVTRILHAIRLDQVPSAFQYAY